MSKRIYKISFTTMLVLTSSLSVVAQSNSVAVQPVASSISVSNTDRDRDGLLGPVRRIRTETAKLSNKAGKPSEGQRQLLETAAYDLKGAKIENAYFPTSGAATLTGREAYKYDDKANISEMTFYNADGSLLGKEVYTYEFDFVGNWTRMTTSVAVIEGGKPSLEPTEVTYRTISYYLDENLAKLTQPASANSSTVTSGSVTNNPTNTPARPSAETVVAPTQAKTEKTAAAIPRANPGSMSKSLLETSVLAATSPTSISTGGNNPVVVMNGEPPPKPAPKPLMKPVSGGVLNGKAIDLPAPVYPELAKRMRATGMVVVEVVIDINGKVISAKAVSGNPTLHKAAVEAALRANFSPTTLSGQPVKVSGVINYKFALSQ